MTGEEAPERHIAQTLEEQKMLELVRQLELEDRGAFLLLLQSKVPRQSEKVGRKPQANPAASRKSASTTISQDRPLSAAQVREICEP